jgi:hypothetical protein
MKLLARLASASFLQTMNMMIKCDICNIFPCSAYYLLPFFSLGRCDCFFTRVGWVDLDIGSWPTAVTPRPLRKGTGLLWQHSQFCMREDGRG